MAKKLNSPRLASIATKVRLDAFTKVKKAIDVMVSHLPRRRQMQSSTKPFCARNPTRIAMLSARMP